jgi:hypothetical protein
LLIRTFATEREKFAPRPKASEDILQSSVVEVELEFKKKKKKKKLLLTWPKKLQSFQDTEVNSFACPSL